MNATDWPFIGIKEGWIENGWTHEQMMRRSLEINIPPQLCYLEPYYMNFLQRPNNNEMVLKQILDIRDPNKGAWIASNRLWTPGQTINIYFNSNAPEDIKKYVQLVVIKYLQPHISMKLNFTNETTGDILVNIAYMDKGGGNSSVGKTGRQQTINLNSDRFQGKSDTSKLDDTVHKFSEGKFNLQRYIVLHEFGHAMGLYHEWTREVCGKNGITCSESQDMNSVMNYFNQGTTGVQGVKPSRETMDSYSPNDIAWLKKVYGNESLSLRSIDKFDLRQLGIIQNWPDELSDTEVENRVNYFLTNTNPDDIVYDDRINSASECIMSPLILNYKQWYTDSYDRVVSTPPSSYWPSSMTQLNIWFDKGESSQHNSIKQWLISDLQPHIRMDLVFEKADSGIMYTVISPAEMGVMTNPSNGQTNWSPAGSADSIGYRGKRVYTIKINSGRGVKKSTILHEICHILGLYHSFDSCKSGGECIKTDGNASIMSYISPPEKGFSSVDIEWLERVYGPPKSKSTPSTPSTGPLGLQMDIIEDVYKNHVIILFCILIILIIIFFISMCM